MIKTSYYDRVKSRSALHFYWGLIPRLIRFVVNENNIRIAKRRGAKIGNNTIINSKLAKISNSNLTIGNDCSIQSFNFDLRSKIDIGNSVIIGENVKIITASHDINSKVWDVKYYGLKIEDFVWLATDVIIMPSCRLIEYGSVCGAASVVVKNSSKMNVYSGNPAIKIAERKEVHSELVISTLLGGDLKAYVRAFKNR